MNRYYKSGDQHYVVYGQGFDPNEGSDVVTVGGVPYGQENGGVYVTIWPAGTTTTTQIKLSAAQAADLIHALTSTIDIITREKP